METGHHSMTKEIKKIANNNLSSINLEENQLSIQLSLDGFSFYIHNKHASEPVAFGVYEFSENQPISPYKHLELVEEIFNKEPLLQHKFSKVSVSHFNNLTTQVPKPFFDKNKLPEYLQYTVKVLENDYIAFDEIINTEIVNVYIPFVNINNFLLDQYGAFIFKHSSTILIENLLNAYKNEETALFFVNVTNANFEVVILKNNKLELFNCFSFTTKEDFIYYILFVAEQLKMNPEEFKLILMGDIEKDSELYKIVYQYVRNISFYTPQNFPELLNTLSPHSHFTLLNQF